MKPVAVLLSVALGLTFLIPWAPAQELRLELARKRQEVVRPTPDPTIIEREAEQAVREYQELAARERLIQEHVLGRDRRRDLDPAIVQQLQALQVQRALQLLR